MKKTLLFLLMWLPLAVAGQQTRNFFPEEDLMPVGAYYYPEHWPRQQWDRDLKRMADLGFTFTHFGEFAWAQMEPREGEFDFEWLDYCVERAATYGLKVIMCTPSPTPPAWLTEKHPEILAVDDMDLTMQHGTRLHVSYNHPTYLHYVEKIVEQLARRYGNDERVWGWQLDNEPHYGKLYDYSETHQQSFRRWLRQKYDSIAALNKAWGTAFWSQTYNHFDQVRIPNKNKAPQGSNPHQLLDFQRFNAEELAAALRFQAEVLERHIAPRQWVTTNYAYFKFLPSVDPFLNRADFDFAAHTMYLTSKFLGDEGGPLAHRLGSGMELAFSNEMAKSVNGYTGIMELQPGQINWGVINPQPLPGAVRMWVWHSFGLGDRFACTYRFRQPLFGSEQTHKGIIETDGVTVQRGGQEYVQAIEELNRLKEQHYRPGVRVPRSVAGRKTAFLWKQDNLLDLANHPHHADYDPWQHFYTYYAGLKSMGAAVTFVQEGDPFNPETHPFMVAPAYQLMDKSLVQKWTDYVEKGGHLVLTSRTGMKNPDGHLWEALQQQPLWQLIGAKTEFFDHLPAAYPGTVQFNGNSYQWHVWGDVLEPEEGTEVLATHTDQFYAGKPAVVRRELGKGTVTYIGIYSDGGQLEHDILQKIYRDTGAETLELPPYVFTEWRDGFFVAVNSSSRPVQAPVPEKAEIIYGEKALPPGGVTVWK